MRWHFEEIFLAVSLNVFLGINRKFLIRIHRDQHLTDVGLRREISFLKKILTTNKKFRSGDVTGDYFYLRK